MRRKIIISIGGVFVIIIMAIVCLNVYMGNLWKKGIYILDSSIDVACEEGQVYFNIDAMVVGEDYLNKIKNKQLDIYLVLDGSQIIANYKLNRIVENKRYFEANICVMLDGYSNGEYNVENILIKDSKDLISEAVCHGCISILPKEEASLGIMIQNTLYNVTDDCVELMYIVDNRSDLDIVIKSISNNNIILDNAVIQVMTNVEKESIVNLNNLLEYSEPIGLLSNKEAYFMISIPIDRSIFKTIQYVPFFIIEYDEEEYKVPVFYRTEVIQPSYNADCVLEYIEREK